MEYILKCGKKTFTGNSVSEAEGEFISWALEQDNFIVDNYTIVSLHESPFGEVRAEVEKSTAELLNNYNYIYVVAADRDYADDDTYEASYHLSKTRAITAAREILKYHNNIASTRVIAHLIGGVNNNNTWDSDSDILCAHFNRTNSPATSSYSWED